MKTWQKQLLLCRMLIHVECMIGGEEQPEEGQDQGNSTMADDGQADNSTEAADDGSGQNSTPLPMGQQQQPAQQPAPQ